MACYHRLSRRGVLKVHNSRRWHAERLSDRFLTAPPAVCCDEMSVQHESSLPLLTTRIIHSHSGHTFPSTPVSLSSAFVGDSGSEAADSYGERRHRSAWRESTAARDVLLVVVSFHVRTPSYAVNQSQPIQELSALLAPSASAPISLTQSTPLRRPPLSPVVLVAVQLLLAYRRHVLLDVSSLASSAAPLSAIERLRPSLQMYRNQVAGHSPLFWHSGTICKPLIPAEYTFYAQLEEQMPAFMPYVPKFYGLLDLEQLTEEMASSLLTERPQQHRRTTVSGSGRAAETAALTRAEQATQWQPELTSEAECA